jgi:Asp-tRNA(Asn)/Glu-tRNA(Gln) amidotransferase A subunit family amidase
VEFGTWHLVERGRGISAARYVSSIQWLHGWSRRVVDWWSEHSFDLLLTPTIATPPPPLGRAYADRGESARAAQESGRDDSVHTAI